MEKIKEKIITFLKEPILYFVIIMIVIQGSVYSNIPKVGHTGDSQGYIDSYDKGSFLHGYINDSRPPV